jgi:hypothetical protein
MDPNRARPTFKQMLLRQGLNALPQILEGWFLRKLVPNHDVVDVQSLPGAAVVK